MDESHPVRTSRPHCVGVQTMRVEVMNPDFIVRILEDLEVSNAVLYDEFVKIQVKMFFYVKEIYTEQVKIFSFMFINLLKPTLETI
jgi:hypothetical protein